MTSKMILRIIVTLMFCVCFFSHILAYEEDNLNMDYRFYYYQQLNDFEKTIYNHFVYSKENFLNNERVVYIIDDNILENQWSKETYINAVKRARSAYFHDNAEAKIWIEHYNLFVEYSYNSVSMIIEPNSITGEYSDNDSGNIREALQTFEKKAQEFSQTLQGSDAEKLRQIHDWLINIAEYDYTTTLPDTHNAYGTLIKGKSVCSGFAYAYKYIADLGNLKVLYVTGNVYDKNSKTYITHAWNIAEVDGKWVLIDPTFDGILRKNNKPIKFLFTPINDDFHYADQQFNYPGN